MQTEHERLREIFLEACEIAPGEDRERFLVQACAEAPALRAQVEEMLRLAKDAGTFFQPFEPDPRRNSVVLPPCKVLQEGPGTVIDRYKLLEQIGEGGFGVVYMAEQVQPVYRRVALKIIKLGMDTRDVIARFDAERQALALMDHPNVARVLDAGATASGRPYFVMELVRGLPITEYCDKHRLTTRERLDLFIAVCDAAQHAHSKGIIHRDLKPSNVLVASQEGRPVPKVIDFGIAKAIQQPLTQKTLFTRFGQMIGTPVYMSPEHLIGEDVDTRSDVYSLGVILYELLTGRQPFDLDKLREAGQLEMMRVIQEEEPVPPSTRLTRLGREAERIAELRHVNSRRLSELVRGDLDWITMKALQKDRTRRYDTPAALVDDVRRHLDHQPVTAGPPGLGYRAWKFVLRHRYGVGAAAAVFVALLVGLVLSTYGLVRLGHERRRAISAEEVAVAQRQVALAEAAKARNSERQARLVSYASDMSLASHALDQSNLGRALALLGRHVEEDKAKDLRGWEWRYMWQQCQSSELFQLGSLSNSVPGLAVSGDGVLGVAADLDGNLAVWDLLGRRLVYQISGVSSVFALSPDGKHLALGDGTIREPATGQVISRLGPGERWTKLAFSRDGAFLAGQSAFEVELWESATRRLLGTHKGYAASGIHLGGVAFSGGGEWLVVGTHDGDLSLLETRSGRALRRWRAHKDSITCVAVSPDSRSIFSGAGFVDDEIKVWSSADGSLRGTLAGHRAWVSALCVSPDGSLLASASADQNIKLWNLETLEPAGTLRGHRHEVWALAFFPDGKNLLSSAKDGSVKVWRVPAAVGAGVRSASEGPTEPLLDEIAYTPGADEALGLDTEGRAGRWSLPSLRWLGPVEPLGSNNLIIASSSRLGLAATTDKAGWVRVWDCQGRRLLTNWMSNAEGKTLSSLAFAAAAPRLVLVVENRNVQMVDTTTWQQVASWVPAEAKAEAPLFPVCVSPDGQFLAAGGRSQTVFALTNGEAIARIPAHTYYADAVAFSPDGAWLATGSMDGTAKLWRVGTWEHAGTFTGHLLGVHTIAFSADNRRLATGSLGREAVKLWDLETMQEVLNLGLPGGVTYGLGFSPDGNHLVVFSAGAGAHCRSAPPLSERAKLAD